MFPKTFGVVAMIVGAIWLIQGAGLAATGSFMDGNPVWAVLGAALAAAGMLSTVVQRRRSRSAKNDHPAS